jgi:hypothetical protein
MAAALEILAHFTPKIRVVLDKYYAHAHSEASASIMPRTRRVPSENLMASEVKPRTRRDV